MRMKTLETQRFKGEHREYSVTNIGPVPGGEAFLFMTDTSAFLLDAGFGFCGEQTADNLDQVLDGRKLDCILLTHSHYDHILGAPYIYERHPEAKVYASQHTAEVIQKHGARFTMRKMDASAAKMYHVHPKLMDKVGDLKVDVIVKEGDIVDTGDMKFKVYDFPGHTFCSIGFYCREERLLLSCESLGVYVGNDSILPIFLVGYGICIDSLEKAQKLDISAMLIPHTGMVTGELCQKMLSDAESNVKEGVKDIVEAAKSGTTDDELIVMFRNRFYTDYAKKLTPQAAFDLNAGYMISVIRKELC